MKDYKSKEFLARDVYKRQEQIWAMAQEHLLFAEPGVHAYSEWLRMELTRRKRNV